MISRLLISFSFLVCLLEAAGSVAGSVRLVDSREADVRGRNDFSGVVVWLEPSAGGVIPSAKPVRTQILQKRKRFVPHIVAAPAGSTVDFPNLDPIFHNAFSNFEGKVFDVGLYAPGTSRSVRFDRPGIVRVFCNIHPRMSAIIAVLTTPYFTTSQPDGRFEIPDVPAGEYQLHVWHERATPQTLQALKRRVTVGDAATTIPLIAISESGFLPVPHKNKYGKDYPPASGDTLYPGAKK